MPIYLLFLFSLLVKRKNVIMLVNAFCFFVLFFCCCFLLRFSRCCYLNGSLYIYIYVPINTERFPLHYRSINTCVPNFSLSLSLSLSFCTRYCYLNGSHCYCLFSLIVCLIQAYTYLYSFTCS